MKTSADGKLLPQYDQYLNLRARGYTDFQIADALTYSPTTMKKWATRIREYYGREYCRCLPTLNSAIYVAWLRGDIKGKPLAEEHRVVLSNRRLQALLGVCLGFQRAKTAKLTGIVDGTVKSNLIYARGELSALNSEHFVHQAFVHRVLPVADDVVLNLMNLKELPPWARVPLK